MKKIEIFGTGCKSCISTEDRIKKKAEEIGVEIDLHHVDDPVEIASRGIITTPAVAVDDQIVHKGGLPKETEIEKWIT